MGSYTFSISLITVGSCVAFYHLYGYLQTSSETATLHVQPIILDIVIAVRE